MAKATTSLVKYGEFTAEDAAEMRTQKADEKSKSSPFVNIKDGEKKRLRFVPPLLGKKAFAIAAVHYIDLPGEGKVVFNCPRVMAKQFCKVCKKADQLYATGNKRDAMKAGKFKPRRRLFANVVVRGEEDMGARILGFGSMIEDQLTELRNDEDFGGDFVNPVNGLDVIIKRTGSGPTDTEYKVYAAEKGKQLPLHEDVTVMNEIIEGQHDLAKYTKVPTADEIDEMLEGGKPARDDDERPSKSSRKPARSIDDDAIDTDSDSDEDE